MFPLPRNFLKFAAAGAFLALTVSRTPAAPMRGSEFRAGRSSRAHSHHGW